MYAPAMPQRPTGQGGSPCSAGRSSQPIHFRGIDDRRCRRRELLALKRTIGELGSIGRNLNQIAQAANQGQLVTSPVRNDLEAMLRVCGALRDKAAARVLR